MTETEKIDLSGNKKVLKEILQPGTGHELPMVGCTVSLHYTGKLTNGTVFDSSVDRGEPFEFALGRGSVIKAFEMCVATMKKGEKCVLTCAPNYAYGDAGSPPSIPPKSTLIFELEMLGWKGEDISPNKDNAIERIIIKPSEKRRKAVEGAVVKVKLVGKYEDRVFEDRELSFTLGEGSDIGVIESVELALEKISVGETSRITIQHKYAFGEKGNEEFKIPPKATVVYEVTLLECEKADEYWKFSSAGHIEQSKLCKDKGANYFAKGNYNLAIKMYKKCLENLPPIALPIDTKEKEEKTELTIAAQNNLSLCYQKLNDNFAAKKSCNKVLDLDFNNIKALFRRGRSNMALNEFSEALKDFQKVLELEPSNKAAANQLPLCKQKIKDHSDREKHLYANMFTKLAAADKQPVQPTDSDVLTKCGEWTEEDARREADLAFERDNNIVMI